MIKIDKRKRSALFRYRINEAMKRGGFSRSRLARETEVDRSTIGQLLNSDETRLPNAQLVADIASALGVTADWLLGLTDHPERPGDLLAAAISLTQAERTAADAQIMDWHREAAGYKIRHVPATLPDMLKTEAMIHWEYTDFLGRTADQVQLAAENTTAWFRSGISDYEIALPIHELHNFAARSGYYAGIPEAVCQAQLLEMSERCGSLYPSLRLFLFDARRVFSTPITVFGPLLAVIYVGRFYLTFREGERVRSLITHFDWLIREASIDARDTPDYIHTLVTKNNKL